MRRFFLSVAVGAVLVSSAVSASVSSASSLPPCQPGVYGLAGDWGPGSHFAHLPRYVRWVHARYGFGPFAWRVVHNVRPSRCV